MRQKQCIMKKPVGRRALICVFILLCAVWTLWGIVRKPSYAVQAYSQAERKQFAEGMNNHRLSAVLHEADGTLAVTHEIDFTNRTENVLPDLVLRTYANAFLTEETSPAAIDEVYDSAYRSGFSAGGLELMGVWWQGKPVSHAYEDGAKTVLRVDTGAMQPGDHGTLKMMYVLSVPECAYRFGRTETAWQIGNAIPVLSVWQDGEWRKDAYSPIGDPFISESANWSLHIQLPEGMTPASSAALQKGADGIWQGEVLCARDLALSCSRGYRQWEKQSGDVQIRVLTASDQGKKALNISEKVLETLCALYGKYPYDTLTVAQIDFPFGGMEYPGLVMVDDSYFTAQDDALELLLAHEIAHQWFYALAGSDGVNQPWQDEALCQWAVLRYVGTRYGKDSETNLRYYYVDAPMQENGLEALTPGSPVHYFGDYASYDSVVYGRGCALLYALDAFTDGGMDACLKAYCHLDPFGLYTRSDFEHAVAAFSGKDSLPLIMDYLDTRMQ